MTDASIDALIDGLADELKPVRPRRTGQGSLWVLLGWAGGATVLIAYAGMRHDLLDRQMPMLSMLSFWLIAGVGMAAVWSAIRMGMPGVGRDYGGWRWAGLVALALPLSALLVTMGNSNAAMESARMGAGTRCLTEAVISGLGVGAALFAWLKAGAPTSPERAGLVVGLAAGSAGATIVALHCSIDNIVHISLWHGLAVMISAAAGRLFLPRFLRW
jgi:hypothetical protein